MNLREIYSRPTRRNILLRGAIGLLGCILLVGGYYAWHGGQSDAGAPVWFVFLVPIFLTIVNLLFSSPKADSQRADGKDDEISK